MKQTTSTAARESGSALAQMAQRLPLSDAHFRRISQLIYQRAGIVLAAHKREMVYNRLVRRLRLLGIHDFGDYRRCWKATRTAPSGRRLSMR